MDGSDLHTLAGIEGVTRVDVDTPRGQLLKGAWAHLSLILERVPSERVLKARASGV